MADASALHVGRSRLSCLSLLSLAFFFPVAVGCQGETGGASSVRMHLQAGDTSREVETSQDQVVADFQAVVDRYLPPEQAAVFDLESLLAEGDMTLQLNGLPNLVLRREGAKLTVLPGESGLDGAFVSWREDLSQVEFGADRGSVRFGSLAIEGLDVEVARQFVACAALGFFGELALAKVRGSAAMLRYGIIDYILVLGLVALIASIALGHFGAKVVTVGAGNVNVAIENSGATGTPGTPAGGSGNGQGDH